MNLLIESMILNNQVMLLHQQVQQQVQQMLLNQQLVRMLQEGGQVE